MRRLGPDSRSIRMARGEVCSNSWPTQRSRSLTYAGYLDRQKADIEAFRREESLAIPPEVEYSTIPGLSIELRQKLGRVRPATLGQAARIDGMTPAALTV